MSEDYISQFYTWATGNTITASRLNGNVSNVTDGLSGGSKAVNVGKVLVGGTEVITSGRAINVTGLTLTGDITSTGTAIDWDLQDNVASALSFDSVGKTGLLEFDTTDSAEGLKTTGFFKIVSDAASLTAVGAFVLGAGGDAGLFFNGTDLTIQTDGAGASGIIFDSEDDTFEFKGSGTLQATFDTTGLNLVSGDVFKINGTSVLSNDTLGSGVVNTSITSTGALNSGSITSGFGNIDVGSSNIDGGTITADTALVGTLSTASQTNITAVGALNGGSITSGFGNIDVGSSNIDGGTITADTALVGTLSTASQTNITSLGTLSSLDISGNIRMPYSTSKYIIGPEQVASNTFRTTFDSIEINGADGLAGGSAMGGGSVIIRGGGAQGNSSTNSYGGHVKIYGGELLGGSTGAGEIFLYTNNTEAMRITGDGHVNIGNASTSNNGIIFFESGVTYHYQNGTGSSNTVRFYRNVDSSGTLVGSITTDGSSTSYNTSSDYRLKENVSPIIDGVSRLMKLKPSRFNFINMPKTEVDGFLAHEVQSVIPEAVTGQKDKVDEEGKPEYQSIDQSKIVPLLVASVQELTKKVEELENKCLK